MKIFSGFLILYTVISLSSLSRSLTHRTLRDFGLQEGSLAYPERASLWPESTDALWLGASRKVSPSSGARGHAEVFLLARLTSPAHTSCHYFIHPCINPAPLPAGAGRSAPSLGCAGAGGEQNGQGRAGGAQSSPAACARRA